MRVAVIELLKKEKFEKLTVADICQAAMVNRMTFYKHFRDKYDLLEYAIGCLIEQIINNASQIAQPVKDFDEFVNFCCVLAKLIIGQSVQSKEVFYALYSSDNGVVYEAITKTMRKYIWLLVSELSKIKKLKYSLETSVEFLSGGVIHLLCYWMFNINKYDAKQFADECETFTRQLLTSGLFFEK